MSADRTVLDYRGQACPAPVIALGRAARATPGATVELLADDAAARFDVPAWCRLTGATLISVDDHPGDQPGTATDWAVYRVLLPG